MSGKTRQDSDITFPTGVSITNSSALYPGQGQGLPVLEIKNKFSHTQVCLQGAHVLSFTPAGGQDLLWVSPRSAFHPGEPIRGGIPLCLPWFGPYQDGSMVHGFARLSVWELTEIKELEDGAHSIELTLNHSPLAGERWLHAFEFRLLLVADAQLDITLSITHRGSVPAVFSAAMHSYFAVAGVENCHIAGLDDCVRIDSTTPDKHRSVQSGPVTLAGTYNSIFLDVPAEQTLSSGQSAVCVTSDAPAAVVWNPGQPGLTIGDIGDAWPGFVCLERGFVADHAKTLAPGETHAIRMTIARPVKPL